MKAVYYCLLIQRVLLFLTVTVDFFLVTLMCFKKKSSDLSHKQYYIYMCNGGEQRCCNKVWDKQMMDN